MSLGPHMFRGTVEALMASAFLLVVYLVLDPGPVILFPLALALSVLVVVRNAR